MPASSTLFITQVNDVYLGVYAEEYILRELSDHFTFFVPGYKFMPAYRNRVWDGKIRLLNTKNGQIYVGLLEYIVNWAEERNYDIIFQDDALVGDEEFSVAEAEEFVSTLNLPFAPKEWQMKGFVHAVRKRRTLLLSPTGSGKSLIIYLLVRYYQPKRTLIIVPTTSLVAQLSSDFADYGWDSKTNVHQIMSGRSKESNAPVVISTWQSIYKMPVEFFEQFSVIIGDECHLFKAKSLTTLMTKLINIPYRIGTTGTLDGTQTHQLVLEGLFGRVKSVATTRELIDKDFLAGFQIKALVLNYAEEVKKEMARKKYQEEIDFLVSNEKRNAFIANLAVSLKQNTLVLFQYVEKHGVPLFEMIRDKVGDKRKVFFVSGKTETEQRESIRSIVESEKDAIIVASSGVYSTGVNIKKLHNIIFTHPGKSRVRTLQSIGRGLRKGEQKEEAVLYDIVDDLTYKNYENFATRHFKERFELYRSEKFSVKIYQVKFK